MHDMSLNENAFENKTLVELPDTVPPTILTASLDFATSILSIFVDEPVRLERLVPTSFFLRNSSGNDLIQIQLNGRRCADFSLSPHDPKNLIVTLSETHESRPCLYLDSRELEMGARCSLTYWLEVSWIYLCSNTRSSILLTKFQTPLHQ